MEFSLGQLYGLGSIGFANKGKPDYYLAYILCGSDDNLTIRTLVDFGFESANAQTSFNYIGGALLSLRNVASSIHVLSVYLWFCRSL